MAFCASFVVLLIVGTTAHSSSRFRKQQTVDAINQEVILSLMSSANEILTEARLGQEVRLAVSLKHKPGTTTSVKGVSLFNCVTITSDGSQVKKLTDENGCSVSGSPIVNITSAISNVFPLFSLRGHTDITFQCDLELCLQELDLKCQNINSYVDFWVAYGVGKNNTHWSRNAICACHDERCSEYNANTRRRRSEPHKHNKTHLSTNIRVLPSVKDEEIEMPNYDGWASRAEGPLLYLNPVTCSLFIILLTIFLALYVIFIKSLKKSVDQIKADMTQGRDRFRFVDSGVYCSVPVQPQTTPLP